MELSPARFVFFFACLFLQGHHGHADEVKELVICDYSVEKKKLECDDGGVIDVKNATVAHFDIPGPCAKPEIITDFHTGDDVLCSREKSLTSCDGKSQCQVTLKDAQGRLHSCDDHRDHLADVLYVKYSCTGGESGANVGAIVGGVIGVLILALIVAILAFFFIRRRKQAAKDDQLSAGLTTPASREQAASVRPVENQYMINGKIKNQTPTDEMGATGPTYDNAALDDPKKMTQLEEDLKGASNTYDNYETVKGGDDDADDDVYDEIDDDIKKRAVDDVVMHENEDLYAKRKLR